MSEMTRLIAVALLAWTLAAQDVEVAASVAFTEGPAQDRDGNVYFTETVNSRIMRLAPSGALTVWRENSNGANGLLVDAENRLVACEAGGSGTKKTPRVTRTDLKTGRIEVLAEGGELVAPNDVSMDGKGRLYFTDLPGSAIYRIDAPGKFTRIAGTPDIQRANGIQISGDDRILYVVEANQAKDGHRRISAFDLQSDGTVRNVRVHYNFYPGRSADGMSIDEQGNLYAAAGLHRPRGTSETLDTKCGVHVISPAGKLIRFIPIPEDTITNTTFGGPDRKTLFVTAGKTLFRVRVDVPGLLR